MSSAPIPPMKSPVVVHPPKHNNTWLIIFQVVIVLFLMAILALNILRIPNNTPPTPTATPKTTEGAPTPLSAIILNLIPPQSYQFSDEIALGINANQIQNPNDITAELLRFDGSSFENPIILEIRDNKIIIPASSFVGTFQVKATLSSDTTISALANVKIAEPNWETMSMTVKPAISFGEKTALVPGITHIIFNGVPGGMNFTLGSDPTPHQQDEEITVTESFASADGGAILEIHLEGVSAEDGSPFRHALAQEVSFAKKADDKILSGTFNQYPVSVDNKGQPLEKTILNQLAKCQEGLWTLGKDVSDKEMGLVTGYVSLAQLSTFLTDKNPWEQSLFPKDIANAYILRPTSDGADGCSFGKGALGTIVYKLGDVTVGKITLTQVIIPGYYKPAP